MDFEVPTESYEAIRELIHSEDSPVGIDAEKTHVLILHKLASIEERLRKLEEAKTAG